MKKLKYFTFTFFSFTRKIIFIFVLAFISFDFLVYSININRGSNSNVSKNVKRLPSFKEIDELKNSSVTYLKTQINKFFTSEPQLKNSNLIRLSFKNTSLVPGSFLISVLNGSVKEHLNESAFFRNHFQPVSAGYSPLACYPGYWTCNTIETNFNVNGEYSIKDLIDLVKNISTTFKVSIFKYPLNIWNDFLKDVIKNNLDNLVDNLSISKILKVTIKDQINKLCDPKNLITFLSSFDPNSKYLIKIDNWSTFSKYFYQEFSSNSLTNVVTGLSNGNDYFIKWNLNLFPEGFMKINGNDLSKDFDNQVTYSLNYKDNKFNLTNNFSAKNFYFGLFLNIFSFI